MSLVPSKNLSIHCKIKTTITRLVHSMHHEQRPLLVVAGSYGGFGDDNSEFLDFTNPGSQWQETSKSSVLTADIGGGLRNYFLIIKIIWPKFMRNQKFLRLPSWLLHETFRVLKFQEFQWFPWGILWKGFNIFHGFHRFH